MTWTQLENQLSDPVYYGLCFFHGDFRRVLEEGMRAENPRRWANTFMKPGLALFLLYLYRGDALPAGAGQMCSLAEQALDFHAQMYGQGLEGPASASAEEDGAKESRDSSDSLFAQCISRWKRGTAMSGEEEEELLVRLEQWIERYTEAVLRSRRVTYYGAPASPECAAFIAALGEVKESRGETGAKERLMEAYRLRYPDHRAFHEELCSFGMADSR